MSKAALATLMTCKEAAEFLPVIKRCPKPYMHYIWLHGKKLLIFFRRLGRGLGERVKRREGEAVVEATGGEAGAFEAKREEASADASGREGAFAGGTGPGGIGLIELRGGKGLIRIRGTLLGKEKGERVLIFLKSGVDVLDARGLSRGFCKPELEALDGPVENGGEGELEVVSEL